MKNLLYLWLLLCCSTLHAQIIPFDSEQWSFGDKGTIPEFYEGEMALYLKGSAAQLPNANFKNGVIEFDVYFKDLWTFSGFFFRVQDGNNYEELYFRPHRSGSPDAYQYCPKLNGKASWQLYHDQHRGVFTGNPEFYPAGKLNGYNGKIDLPFDRWMHVKLVISDNQAAMYLDREEKPRFFIHEFKGPKVKGPVGIYTGWGGVHFANFSIVHNDNQQLPDQEKLEVVELENRIKSWQVSNVVEEQKLTDNQIPGELLDGLKWTKLESEPTGVTNLSRLATVEGKKNTVLARLEINANEDMVKALTLGYSDRLMVYCNGRKIYAGNNGYRSRDFRYLGTIGLFDEVYLPLKKGKNIIYCAVSESFGGWGVMGQMDRSGVKLKGE